MTRAARDARTLHGLLEPLHTVMYFMPEAKEEYESIGLEPVAQGYVAGRASPLGAVGPEAVTAIFYNFSPALVRLGLPGAWDQATPAQVLAARARAAQRFYERIEAPAATVGEATELLREAATDLDIGGRALAAANLAVEPTGKPFADLWQAITVLREHRGDGHVAVLTTERIGQVEALVLNVAWSEMTRRFLQRTRLWDDDTWAAAQRSLVERGWLDEEGALTGEGRTAREQIEEHTDRLASAPYARLGPDRCRELYDLLRPLADAVNGAGIYKRELDLPARPE